LEHAHLTSNPFALMMMPEAVFAAIEHSDRLSRLKSRICRPLDGPRAAPAATEVGAFDAAVDLIAEPVETVETVEAVRAVGQAAAAGPETEQ
jgi:hypothetical protein